MTNLRHVLVALPLWLATGCYGKATADSCYRKYVVNHRGDAVRDTYAACLDRAYALEHGIANDVADLRRRVMFETGCSDATMTVFEQQGNAAVLVGADACGQRITYSRRLRRRLGARTTRNTQWEVVGVTTSPAAAPAAQPARAPADRVFGKAGAL